MHAGYILSVRGSEGELSSVSGGRGGAREEEQKKPEENDEAAIIPNVHLALPTSSARAFWETERLS